MASQRSSGPAPTGGRFALWSVLGTAILVLDQVSKFWFERNLDPGIQLPVTSFFNFVLAHNRGAAFSFLADAGGWQHGLFVTLAFVVIILMVRYLWHYNHRTLFALALTLVAAGAAGNLIDRVAFGYVTDMFQTTFINFAIFNVADICIVVGGIAFAVYFIFGWERFEKQEEKEEAHDGTDAEG